MRQLLLIWLKKLREIYNFSKIQIDFFDKICYHISRSNIRAYFV